MLRNRLRVAALLLSATLGWGSEAATPLQAFTPDSLQRIQQRHQGRPFLLIVWSLDCTSCVRELNTLADQVKRHPNLPLIMVSTDDPSRHPAVQAMLAKHGLDRLETWIFEEGNAQRLRYAIDKTWYGEMPRSYFYDARHQRVPLSGVLTADHINAWLTATHG